MSVAANIRERQMVIRGVFIAAALALIFKAMHLQLIDTSFKDKADIAAIGRYVKYPARGTIYDRNGNLLVYNNPMYDLMVTYNQLDPQMDTTRFCTLTGMTKEEFTTALAKDWKSGRFSKSVPFVFKSKISADDFARFEESLYEFPGFFVQLRNARGYPHKFGAHVLGYIREVNKREIERSGDEYAPGDYIGASGLEKEYEAYIKGEKGVQLILKDNLGRQVGSFNDGKSDTPPVAGKDLITTLDLDLQAYGETLMVNKIGSIVAIEPQTGEILAMVSAPYYDPNLLTIDNQNRSKSFTQLNSDPLKPMLDRSILAQYPPGSIFKPVVALVGMQEGTLSPDRGVSCGGAYVFNGQRLTGCHSHPGCHNVETSIQYSCNAYYVTVFRELIDRYGYTNPQKGLDVLNTYLDRFGLGSALGVDVPGERNGYYPTSKYYNGIYKPEQGRWKSIWVRSLGIGQGELLVTNLQLANLAAIIANRGYYYTPHLVKELRDLHGNVERIAEFKEKHEVGIENRYFTPVVDGMEKVVISGTARSAYISDIPICGKTGTAENNQGSGKDHSVFFAFAPKDNPRIAIAVYVENSGWGGSYAAPIASLMIEKYLTGTIRKEREFLQKRMLDANLIPASKP